MEGVLKYSDVLTISEFLKEKGYDKSITITNEVENKDILRKINEDFFYRTGLSDDNAMLDAEILNVVSDGINFIYKVKET